MKTRDIKVLLLAGGRGERMGALTDNHQKCTLPIDGKPIITYILDELHDAFGSNLEILVGVSYRAEDVVHTISKHKKKISGLSYVWHKSGSESFGVYGALDSKIRESPILVVPGDVITQNQIYLRTAEFALKSNTGCLAVNENISEIDTHYLFSINNNFYRDMGVVCFSNDYVNVLQNLSHELSSKDFYGVSLNKIYPLIFENNLLDLHIVNKPWVHIGYSSDLDKNIENVIDTRKNKND